ncbi:P-loop containing nucleoside triphosphate hydrolase protein [Pelagophyceae sp. CCMP2097]|nr:P-loop containing nucleoside triphosphate hydrolase protein [Pelagophyceae sp. CCMP2097]
MAAVPVGGVPDMTSLENLGEGSMLQNLKTRLIDASMPYTFISNVLVAVNPLKAVSMPPYEQFANACFDPNAPHPNALAELAFQRLATGRSLDQSIVVSGESGSGKTETSKIVIAYLTRRVGVAGSSDDLAARVVAISPVLEGFGNASTHRNPNSSRFGRFIKLLLSQEGEGRKASLHLAGGELETYLLEKSRVVRQGGGESSFHSFHMLVDSRPSKRLAGLLKGAEHQHRSMPPKSGKVSEQHRNFGGSIPALAAVAQSLAAMHMTTQDCESVWCVLAAIVTLADAEVGVREDAASREKVAAIDVSSGSPLFRAAELLQIDALSLGEALSKRAVHTAGETLEVLRSREDAMTARDAASRWLYGALFDSLVAQCNVALGSREDPASQVKFVGILDIFGFETLESNGLETLLINYANEALQQLFCDAIFRAELELYAAEGIDDASGIEPPDSKATIEFISGKGPPPGVLRILDSQCATGSHASAAAAGADGSDERDATFLRSLRREHAKTPALAKTPPLQQRHMFHIQHFAGVVGYTVVSRAGWVEANLDAVPDGAPLAVSGSKDAFIAKLAGMAGSGSGSGVDVRASKAAPSRRMSAKVQKTVCSRFVTSMTSLAATLAATDCGFVRCIKPNAKMQKDNFEESYVREQLRALGLVAACEVLRVGLPHRVEYAKLVATLPSSAKAALEGEPAELVVAATLLAFDVPTDSYRLGRTRVFFPASALRIVNDVLSFDEAAEPERAREIARRLVEAKMSASACREAATEAATYAHSAREAAEACDEVVAASAVESGYDDGEEGDESALAGKAAAEAASADDAANKAIAAADAAQASARKAPKSEAPQAAAEAAKFAATATGHAKLARAAAAATKAAAAVLTAATDTRAGALGAGEAAEAAADAAEVAAAAAANMARRLRLDDAKAACADAKAQAALAEGEKRRATELIANTSNSIADSKTALSKAAAEAKEQKKLAKAASDEAKNMAKFAQEVAEEAIAADRLAAEKAEAEAKALAAKKAADAAAAEKEAAAKKAAAASAASAAPAEIVEAPPATPAEAPPAGDKPGPPSYDEAAAAAAAAAAPTSPTTTKGDDDEDGPPLEHEAVSERLNLFRQRVSERMLQKPAAGDVRDVDGSASDDSDSDDSDSDSDGGRKKRKSDGKPPSHWATAHLQRFKRWVLLERAAGCELAEPWPQPLAHAPASTSLLRDMRFNGLEAVPLDAAPGDPRPALQHACVRRRKGALSMSSQAFEFCLGTSNEALLSAKKTSLSIFYHIFDESRPATSASKRSQVLARICEVSQLAGHDGANDVALFGHQRAARGGAPREIGVILTPAAAAAAAAGLPPPTPTADKGGRPTTPPPPPSATAESDDDAEASDTAGPLLDRFAAMDPSLALVVQRAPAKRDGKYSLDFRGRGKVASVKNFQLVVASGDGNYGDDVVLQFCKVGANKFNLDYRAPFTPLTAFALAVSTCLA